MLWGMDANEKAQENRIRGMARRRGLALQRHRARDPGHVLYGTYQITSADGSVAAAKPNEAFGRQYGLTLTEAEQALRDWADRNETTTTPEGERP